MRLLVLLSLAIVGTPAFASDQFDLICTGFVTGGQETTRHYRVDLAANKWCAGDPCAARPIEQVLPDVIWFERHEPTYGGDLKIAHYVDRTTGKWYWRLGPMEIEGTCSPAPFSGFPALVTKF